MNDFSHMRQVLEQWNLELTDEMQIKFQVFYDMLVEKNKVMNLTAITEFDDVVEKHFLDNLSLFQVLDLNQPMKVLDLGTGAGFPGIVLKIVFPNLRLCFLNSRLP